VELANIRDEAGRRWPERVKVNFGPQRCELECDPSDLLQVCEWLHSELDYSFAGLIVEEHPSEWEFRYVFHAGRQPGWIHVLMHRPLSEQTFPSISSRVHAADWHEREIEDLFELVFAGHPRLGDFVLHNDAWQEGLSPMRKNFDATKPLAKREPDLDWRPLRIVHAPGAFAMPIGPIYSGVTESAHFLLETVGEDVIRAIPRLFYKYRAVEKIAEGRSLEHALLLAERFNATTAFAHALAFCQAVETLCNVAVPERAKVLRVFLAELERLRHHAGAIQEICESTALVVATNQAALLEEDLLRLCGAFAGHRYLFGLTVCGGLSCDFDTQTCRKVVAQARETLERLDILEEMLRNSSSFLDRLEEVGMISEREARSHGLVGPVARASGLVRDLREVQPYSGYDALEFDVPCEREGDGYARLRILFAEARQSVRLMENAAAILIAGPVRAPELKIAAGAAMGWAETPRGATFHWLRINDDGEVVRYRIISPSFANWHGFYLAAEDFAFQDFPIILASFGLSVAESDR
jgi:Ni,Fe-hydrogenase III large subunit/Ni,Fe-hydrogenase III component G